MKLKAFLNIRKDIMSREIKLPATQHSSIIMDGLTCKLECRATREGNVRMQDIQDKLPAQAHEIERELHYVSGLLTIYVNEVVIVQTPLVCCTK